MKPVYDLRDLENWATITRGITPPIRLGVIGDPVAHSLSPQLQNAALRASAIEMQYARFQIAPNELKPALRRMQELEFVGCNLTVPHKVAAIKLVAEIRERAEEIGAINTVAFRHGKSLGWNTDRLGFSRGLWEAFDFQPGDLRILILGAGGGAGRATAWQCAAEGCPRLVLVNRDFRKVQHYTRELSGYSPGSRNPEEWLRAIPWQDDALRAEFAQIDLLVNATPLGLKTSDPLPLPADLLRPSLLVYDLTYGSEASALLRAAESAGARTANGLTMLLHQGALAFEHWFNQSAPRDAMRGALGMRPAPQ